MDAAAPTHTFGGLAFDRNIFELETDAAAVGADMGGSSPAQEPVVAPDAAAPVQLTADDIASFRALAGALPGIQSQQQQLAQLLARATAPPATAPDLPQWDPFDPASVKAHMRAELIGDLEQRLAAAEAIAQNVQAKDGQAYAMHTFDQLKQDPAFGDFNNELAWAVAIPLLNDPSVDGTQALQFAARMVATDRKTTWDQAFTAGQEALKKQLAEAGNAIVDPAAGAAAAVLQPSPDALPGESPYRTAARMALSKLRPAQVT